jgi:hypothetical protein
MFSSTRVAKDESKVSIGCEAFIETSNVSMML